MKMTKPMAAGLAVMIPVSGILAGAATPAMAKSIRPSGKVFYPFGVRRSTSQAWTRPGRSYSVSYGSRW